MSTKSQGSHILAPDKAVANFSPELESYYECLHRLLCTVLSLPDSLDTIDSLCNKMKSYYYYIRDELESDGGISSQVACALPIPNTSNILKTLHAWEYSEEGNNQFKQRINIDKSDNIIDAGSFWSNVRFTIFEAQRALIITRQRLAEPSEQKQMRRYPWLTEPHLDFND